jgi:hypothetical protein
MGCGPGAGQARALLHITDAAAEPLGRGRAAAAWSNRLRAGQATAAWAGSRERGGAPWGRSHREFREGRACVWWAGGGGGAVKDAPARVGGGGRCDRAGRRGGRAALSSASDALAYG